MDFGGVAQIWMYSEGFGHIGMGLGEFGRIWMDLDGFGRICSDEESIDPTSLEDTVPVDFRGNTPCSHRFPFIGSTGCAEHR